MRVSRLEVRGFKSFASPASLEFGDGVTAVVGPNGSGKSNLVDAIRLVLGGASARELRGQRLDQVIFSGGDRRAALGMAEVTVVFDNEDGRMPVDEVEVALSRRVYRDGASEFRRNGQRIRLRDVGRLLDATGLAQAGYAIIAQNDIESIIRASPGQRRHLVEEAAGVRGAQVLIEDSWDRIQELDRWLEGSVGRLAELMPRLEELRQQAEVAQEAQGLRERLEDLRGSLERAAWLDALGEARKSERQLDGARRRQESAARAFAEYDQHYQRERDRLEELEAGRLEGERLRGQMALRLQQVDSALEKWRERAQQAAATALDAQTQLVEVAADLSALGASPIGDPGDSAEDLELQRSRVAELSVRLQALSASRQELRRQLDESDREERELGRQLTENSRAQVELEAGIRARGERLQQVQLAGRELEQSAASCRAELGSVQERASVAADTANQRATELEQAVRGEAAALDVLGAAESALNRIISQERAAAAQAAAHDALIEERRRGRPIAEAIARGELSLRHLGSVLGPRLDSDTRAVEAALGELQMALVGSEEEAKKGLGLAGGAAEVVCWPCGDVQLAGEPLPGCRPLAGALEGSGEELALVSRLCAQTCLADDREAAGRWLEAVPLGRAVLPDGTVIGRGFEITAPSGVGELQTFQQSKLAQQGLLRVRAQLEEAQRQLDWAREQHRRQRTRVDQAREAAARAAATAAGERQLELRLEERFAEMSERADRLRAEEERERAQLEQGKAHLEERVHQHGELQEQSLAVQRAHQAARDAVLTLDDSEREVKASLDRVRLAVAEIEMRQRERADRVRQQAEARARLLDRERQARTRCEVAETGAAVALALAQQAAQARLALARDAHLMEAAAPPSGPQDDPLQQLAALERRRAELEAALAQAATVTRGLEHDLLAQRGKVEQARSRIGDGLEGDEEGLRPREDPARAAQEISRWERRLQVLGPINELAPSQLQDLLDRTEGLRSAHADTSAARGDIEAILERLRRVVDDRLQDTMRTVTAEFERTWRELFGAGRATLLKVDSGAGGSWGVDMEVQPQGKRVIPMGMLSGGERALTALALILALQAVSPSPFYVFDEVDAALDEVNVANFARILIDRSRHSQFLVVTHSLTTMARASHLYGVTQDGRGSSRVLSVRLSEDGRSLRDEAGGELVEAVVGG